MVNFRRDNQLGPTVSVQSLWGIELGRWDSQPARLFSHQCGTHTRAIQASRVEEEPHCQQKCKCC